ncbi:BTBD12 [Acanthosepion pharaonis]|uniref:BTBD12 n=1 Tax=Acanthosepion pharaonis TaxID=158019 RepID=A0A812EL58_ACAPH|nr:BTBD12 [Sepia pharaonis]
MLWHEIRLNVLFGHRNSILCRQQLSSLEDFKEKKKKRVVSSLFILAFHLQTRNGLHFFTLVCLLETPIKNGKSPIELASAASKEPKKRTSQRSQSSSLPQTAPLSPTEALTRRRTRSSERKIQEAEQNGDADNLKFPNGSPVLPSFSGAASKGTSESKPAKCSSQESKKQTCQTLKLSKVKVESPEKDETLKQTPAKKLVKSEQVRSIPTPEKERTVPATKRRSSRSRSKSSETSDSLNLSEKSSPKADTSGGKKVKRKKLYQESPKTPTVKLDQPPKKRAQKSSKQDRIPSKCVQRKNTEKKNENNVSSEMVTTATGKSPPNLQSLTGDKERISNNAANTSQNNTVKCPTCKDLIPEEGLGRHILMCLKNKYQVDAKSRLPVLSDREQFRKDEALARQIHEDMNKDLHSHKDSKSTEDLTFCHVCQKDLSHMNSMWKAKHINHCFDNTDEENARKKKKLAVNARQQVPACPMCGKQFKTGALRRCHLKKCAQDLAISPEKAVKLIAEQEKNFKPSLPAPATSSSTSARSLHNKQNKLPDEQMQVALALSSSLFEEQKKLNEQLAETVKNIHQGVNRDLRKLKKSQKKASASMPLLLTISKEDQLARNAQRVDSIISEPAHTMHFPKQFPHSSLSLNYGDVYQLHENTSCSSSLHSFWSRASLMDSSLTPNLFYIQSLMPPIQLDKVTAGSRLKPLSAIPGRGLDKEDIPSVTDNLPDSSAVPSTQTAVLLAELAQSNEEDLDDEESSGSTFEPTQGFYLSQKASDTSGTPENKALAVLSEDLCSLVNKPYLSDIEFIAADNSRVCAHQLLLSVRCPLILSLAVQRENHLVIDMKDVSHNALLAFLRYLYAGRVDFEKNVTADLLQLSRKFNLPQLAAICEKTLQALIDEACYTPSVESVAGDIPEPLEIGDDHLQGNEEDGSMTVDNNSLLEPNKEDMGFGESTSEKLCPLPGVSPSKSPQSTALRSSPNCSYRELPAALDEQIFMTITGPSDAEFSPEKQHNQKPPIPGYDLLTDCSTSVIEKAAEFIAENISAKNLDCKDSSFNSHFPTTPEVDNEIANKQSFNSSFINDFISSSSPVMSQMEDSLHLVVDAQKNSNSASHSTKTPVIANRKGRKKKPAIPSPFTPMPLYTQMTTPELKAEMKKHGCKQMPHEKMVAHLMDIYQKTHQYETDSDLDQSAIHLETPSEIPHSSLGIARLQTRRNTQDCFLRVHNEKKSPVMSKKPAAKLSKKAKSSALGSGVSAQRSSSESDSANVVDLDKSDAVGAYEESFMTNEDDIPCSQQQTSGSSDNLHDKLREFVLKSPEIYTKMILYEPIDFDHLLVSLVSFVCVFLLVSFLPFVLLLFLSVSSPVALVLFLSVSSPVALVLFLSVSSPVPPLPVSHPVCLVFLFVPLALVLFLSVSSPVASFPCSSHRCLSHPVRLPSSPLVPVCLIARRLVLFLSVSRLSPKFPSCLSLPVALLALPCSLIVRLPMSVLIACRPVFSCSLPVCLLRPISPALPVCLRLFPPTYSSCLSHTPCSPLVLFCLSRHIPPRALPSVSLPISPLLSSCLSLLLFPPHYSSCLSPSFLFPLIALPVCLIACSPPTYSSLAVSSPVPPRALPVCLIACSPSCSSCLSHRLFPLVLFLAVSPYLFPSCSSWLSHRLFPLVPFLSVTSHVSLVPFLSVALPIYLVLRLAVPLVSLLQVLSSQMFLSFVQPVSLVLFMSFISPVSLVLLQCLSHCLSHCLSPSRCSRLSHRLSPSRCSRLSHRLSPSRCSRLSPLRCSRLSHRLSPMCCPCLSPPLFISIFQTCSVFLIYL